jgi:hypothetical protein
VEDVIDPRDTRPYLCEFVALARARLALSTGPRLRAGVQP